MVTYLLASFSKWTKKRGPEFMKKVIFLTKHFEK